MNGTSDEFRGDVLPEIDNNLVLSMMLLGITLMWVALSNFTMNYFDIGINRNLFMISCSAMAAVSMILSLMSMRRSEVRFSMMLFTVSIMVLITCVTPMITGYSTDEMVIGTVAIFVCMVCMAKHGEWMPFAATLIFLVTEALDWTIFYDDINVVIVGFAASGIIYTYYSCGIFLYRDLGRDMLRVTHPTRECALTADSSDIFEITNGVIPGMLVFVSGIYLLTSDFTNITCVPVMLISTIVIAISFFGMEKGYIPEGMLSLVIGLYFLCKTISMFATGYCSIELLALISVIPLVFLLIIFRRRGDYPRMFICLAFVLYFVMMAMFDYVQYISVLLVLSSFVFLYSGICRLVYRDLGIMLPMFRLI